MKDDFIPNILIPLYGSERAAERALLRTSKYFSTFAPREEILRLLFHTDPDLSQREVKRRLHFYFKKYFGWTECKQQGGASGRPVTRVLMDILSSIGPVHEVEGGYRYIILNTGDKNSGIGIGEILDTVILPLVYWLDIGDPEKYIKRILEKLTICRISSRTGCYEELTESRKSFTLKMIDIRDRFLQKILNYILICEGVYLTPSSVESRPDVFYMASPVSPRDPTNLLDLGDIVNNIKKTTPLAEKIYGYAGNHVNFAVYTMSLYPGILLIYDMCMTNTASKNHGVKILIDLLQSTTTMIHEIYNILIQLNTEFQHNEAVKWFHQLVRTLEASKHTQDRGTLTLTQVYRQYTNACYIFTLMTDIYFNYTQVLYTRFDQMVDYLKKISKAESRITIGKLKEKPKRIHAKVTELDKWIEDHLDTLDPFTEAYPDLKTEYYTAIPIHALFPDASCKAHIIKFKKKGDHRNLFSLPKLSQIYMLLNPIRQQIFTIHGITGMFYEYLLRFLYDYKSGELTLTPSIQDSIDNLLNTFYEYIQPIYTFLTDLLHGDNNLDFLCIDGAIQSIFTDLSKNYSDILDRVYLTLLELTQDPACPEIVQLSIYSSVPTIIYRALGIVAQNLPKFIVINILKGYVESIIHTRIDHLELKADTKKELQDYIKKILDNSIKKKSNPRLEIHPDTLTTCIMFIIDILKPYLIYSIDYYTIPYSVELVRDVPDDFTDRIMYCGSPDDSTTDTSTKTVLLSQLRLKTVLLDSFNVYTHTHNVDTRTGIHFDRAILYTCTTEDEKPYNIYCNGIVMTAKLDLTDRTTCKDVYLDYDCVYLFTNLTGVCPTDDLSQLRKTYTNILKINNQILKLCFEELNKLLSKTSHPDHIKYEPLKHKAIPLPVPVPVPVHRKEYTHDNIVSLVERIVNKIHMIDKSKSRVALLYCAYLRGETLLREYDLKYKKKWKGLKRIF